MTNAEAEFQAEDLLRELKDLVDRLQSTCPKVCNHLNDLLEQVFVSHRGLASIDQPLDTAWSLYNISILEAVRKCILPILTNRPPADEVDICTRLATQTSGIIDGNAVQEVRD